MSQTSPALGRIGTALLLGFAAVMALSAQVSPPDAAALGQTAQNFIDLWLVQREPEAAVQSHLSGTITDERLVPVDWFPAGEYSRRFSGAAIREPRDVSADVFRKRMVEYLESFLNRDAPRPTQLGDLLATFSPPVAQQTKPRLWDRIKALEPRALPALPAIAYRVSRSQDIAWTVSSTGAYRAALDRQIETTGITPQAVVLRMRPIAPDQPSQLLFMLWADEAKTGRGWKLWGIEPQPVN